MSHISLLAFSAIALLLLLLLGWLSLSRQSTKAADNPGSLPERESRHISYLPYINQALASTDIEFLRTRGQPSLAARVEKERRQIALKYLRALRSDFEKLVDFARMIAVMSPEVELAHELQGMRLRLGFLCRYHLVYTRVFLNVNPGSALGDLSATVSVLTARMEAAISELGEQAALSANLSSLQ